MRKIKEKKKKKKQIKYYLMVVQLLKTKKIIKSRLIIKRMKLVYQNKKNQKMKAQAVTLQVMMKKIHSKMKI